MARGQRGVRVLARASNDCSDADMKILHVIGWYFPEGRGGSEVYLASLAQELKRLGHESVIAVPSREGNADAEHEGVQVYRYAADSNYMDARGERAPHSVASLMERVHRQKPDRVHFHSWVHDASYWHARAIREAGFPIYLTLHTADLFCARGTMLKWGLHPCDGEMRPIRCAACYFQQKGWSPLLGGPLAMAGAAMEPLGACFSGRWGSAWRFPRALRLKRKQLRETWRICSKVVAVCDWMKASLLLNDCPLEKIALSRQGVVFTPSKDSKREFSPENVLRFGFLGRLSDVKGVDLLIEAFRKLRTSRRAILELRGIPQEASYLKKLKRSIENDDRFAWIAPGSSEEVREWLGSLDALVVPSRWLETGPLVVYEAFAAGVPVIGARRGGIAELVRDGVDGLLFEPDSVRDLERVLQNLCENPSRLSQLQKGIGSVRTMREVALEMDALYREGPPS